MRFFFSLSRNLKTLSQLSAYSMVFILSALPFYLFWKNKLHLNTSVHCFHFVHFLCWKHYGLSKQGQIIQKTVFVEKPKDVVTEGQPQTVNSYASVFFKSYKVVDFFLTWLKYLKFKPLLRNNIIHNNP